MYTRLPRMSIVTPLSERSVAGVAGEDVRGDDGMAFHYELCSSSSVASGLAAKRSGTNVVPSPAET